MLDQDIPISDNFREILVEFVTAYILDKPGSGTTEILNYSVGYFSALQAKHKKTNKSMTAVKSSTTVGSGHHSEEDEERPPLNISKHRRKSVCAEPYDPEKGDDTERIVHSKTDEQRQRLWNSVKDILLFRSLDQEQVIFPSNFYDFYS